MTDWQTRARVAEDRLRAVAAVCDTPDDVQQWEDEDGAVREVPVVDVARVRAYLWDTDRLLDVDEIAVRCRVSRMTIYRLINAGTLPAVFVGKRRRVRESVLTAYLNRGTP